MITEKKVLLASTILRSTGAAVSVAPDESGLRSGMEVWFHPWNRREGPVFRIRPTGLNRHRVSMDFGSSSQFCLNRIADRKKEQTQLATALLNSLPGNIVVPDVISADTAWTADRREIFNQHDDNEIIETTTSLMVPMIAAMAELIGFEDVSQDVPELEGTISKALVTKRERSVRNRLLALRIHGYLCGTCGLEPTERFGEALGGILEVHHIEPISLLGEPREYDPTTDLIPLCPNCHRMIHKRNPPLTPGELRKELEVLDA